MDPVSLVPAALGLVLCPLLLGVINRVKSGFAGRDGPPLDRASTSVVIMFLSPVTRVNVCAPSMPRGGYGHGHHPSVAPAS